MRCSKHYLLGIVGCSSGSAVPCGSLYTLWENFSLMVVLLQYELGIHKILFSTSVMSYLLQDVFTVLKREICTLHFYHLPIFPFLPSTRNIVEGGYHYHRPCSACYKILSNFMLMRKSTMF